MAAERFKCTCRAHVTEVVILTACHRHSLVKVARVSVDETTDGAHPLLLPLTERHIIPIEEGPDDTLAAVMRRARWAVWEAQSDAEATEQALADGPFSD